MKEAKSCKVKSLFHSIGAPFDSRAGHDVLNSDQTSRGWQPSIPCDTLLVAGLLLNRMQVNN